MQKNAKSFFVLIASSSCFCVCLCCSLLVAVAIFCSCSSVSLLYRPLPFPRELAIHIVDPSSLLQTGAIVATFVFFDGSSYQASAELECIASSWPGEPRWPSMQADPLSIVGMDDEKTGHHDASGDERGWIALRAEMTDSFWDDCDRSHNNGISTDDDESRMSDTHEDSGAERRRQRDSTAASLLQVPATRPATHRKKKVARRLLAKFSKAVITRLSAVLKSALTRSSASPFAGRADVLSSECSRREGYTYQLMWKRASSERQDTMLFYIFLISGPSSSSSLISSMISVSLAGAADASGDPNARSQESRSVLAVAPRISNKLLRTDDGRELDEVASTLLKVRINSHSIHSAIVASYSSQHACLDVQMTTAGNRT
ncbi:hypothetical protein KCU61_g791, partial [Aureobasidium melanogenum]